MNEKSRYDLEERLLEFSVRVIRLTKAMEKSAASQHLAQQLLRAATSPYANHGEAEAAESRDDFIHKLSICHKELRETRRWIRLIQRAELVGDPELLTPLIGEAEELVRIFSASIRTARATRPPPRN